MSNRNSVTPAAGEKPRLTEEEKKLNHILSEKKRRDNIREKFNLLADNILMGMEGRGRSEASVLSKTVCEVKEQIAIQEKIKAAAIAKGLATRDDLNVMCDPERSTLAISRTPSNHPLRMDSANGEVYHVPRNGPAVNTSLVSMQPTMGLGGLQRTRPPMPAANRRSSSRSSAASMNMGPPLAGSSRPHSRASNGSQMGQAAGPASRRSSHGNLDYNQPDRRPSSSSSAHGLPTQSAQTSPAVYGIPPAHTPPMYQGYSQVMIQVPGRPGPYTVGWVDPQQMQMFGVPPASPYGTVNPYPAGSMMSPGMQNFGMMQIPAAGTYGGGQPQTAHQGGPPSAPHNMYQNMPAHSNKPARAPQQQQQSQASSQHNSSQSSSPSLPGQGSASGRSRAVDPSLNSASGRQRGGTPTTQPRRSDGHIAIPSSPAEQQKSNGRTNAKVEKNGH